MIIPLYGKHGKGKGAIIDDEEVDKVCGKKWWLNNCGYVVYIFKANRKTYSILLSRIILGLTRGDKIQVDHINRNTLDNRKQNLRLATHSQNGQNRGDINKNRKYGVHVRGTAFTATGNRVKRWLAQVWINNKKINLGYYMTQEEAGAVAKAFRLKNMTHTVEI